MAGNAGIQVPLTVYFTQTAAGAANNDYTLTRGGTLVQSWCIARATQIGGTFQVSRNRAGVVVAVTDAMNASADQAVTFNGIIDDAAYNFVASDAVRLQTVGAATLVDAVVMLVPSLAAQQAVV